MDDTLFTATELANKLDVSSRTLRFYETKSLIKPLRAGNRRVYNYKDHARMKLILRGKRLGFSLSEIKEFLDLYDTRTQQKQQIQLLCAKVSNRIKQLSQQKKDIETTLNELNEIHSEATASLNKQHN